MLEEMIHRAAQRCLDANDLVGLTKGLLHSLEIITTYAEINNKDPDWIINHPIIQLYLYRLERYRGENIIGLVSTVQSIAGGGSCF